jgi:hypothetical protein
MTASQPVPEPLPSPGRDRIVSLLERMLRGPDAPKARALILAAVDDHAAAMVELYARGDDRWGPGWNWYAIIYAAVWPPSWAWLVRHLVPWRQNYVFVAALVTLLDLILLAWLPALLGALNLAIALFLYWFNRRRRDKAKALLGAKSKALRDALVRKQRELARPRPVLRPAPGGARCS